ncbi:MAG: MCE family protein [Actinophytocola sp.]|nr:MCE family protein [Actinophytocola sp.]
MLVKRTKMQLVAFVVISVVAIVYALIRFTDIGKTFGQDIYTVSMEMDESGGIFSNAEVTYRGLNVGRVGELSLTDDGLAIQLNIEPGTPRIPSDLDAVVLNRSAIGEQFVDLRPRKAGGPHLTDGSVIPADRTKTPPETAEVIEHSYTLADSVPIESLRTVVDESYNAFSGTGDDLQLLMDATRDFTATARQHVPETVELLQSGNRVLKTQNEQMGSIKSFSKDLRLLSETLKDSDADIRKLIDASPGAARELSSVVNEVGPGLSALVANLVTLGNISDSRLEGTEQALMTYPALSAGALAVTRKGGAEAPLGLSLNLFDPPPCVKGYEGTDRRPGDDTSDAKHNAEAYCAEPKGSPVAVRGSQNAPFNGIPSVPTEQQVKQNEDRDQESLEEQKEPYTTPGVAGGPTLSLNSLSDLLGLGG